MNVNRIRRASSLLLVTILVFFLMSATVFAEVTEPYEKKIEKEIGNILVTVTANDGSGSFFTPAEDQTAEEVKLNIENGGATQDRYVITVTNSSDLTAKLSFNYVVTLNDQEFATFHSGTCENDAYDACTGQSLTGTFSDSLEAGGSVSYTLHLFGYNEWGDIALTNFSLEAISSSTQATIQNTSGLGTVKIDDVLKSNGDVVEIGENGVKLEAVPGSGATFLAWIDGNNKILSREAVVEGYKSSEKTVTLIPVFVNSNSVPYFMLTNGYLYDDLNDASDAAVATGCSMIVAVNDATLPKGDYTIDEGVTLLIPYDDANSCYVPNGDKGPSTTTSTKVPTATSKPYRKLTLADGANIKVEGSLNLSCLVCNNSQGYGAAPVGAFPLVEMASGSSITVESGGTLVAWGYITGSGNITVNSGGKVYESFQVTDWRGGTFATKMVSFPQDTFLFSQYYVQNIEVPMKVMAGAEEYIFAVVKTSTTGEHTFVRCFIGHSGSSGLFTMQDGYFIKTYDGTRDRLVLDIHGSMIFGSLTLELMGKTIDTANYAMPITNNITINIHSGTTTLPNRLALLPGAEMTVGRNATLKLTSKGYVYDSDEWLGKKFVYKSGGNANFVPLKYAPGRTYNRTDADDIVDAKVRILGKVDASGGNVYVTSSGADIHLVSGGSFTNGTGTATTYQTDQTTTGLFGMQPKYTAISVTSASVAAGTVTTCAGSLTPTVKVDPNCENFGHEAYWTCSICSRHYSDANATTEIPDLTAWLAEGGGGYIAPKGHAYGATSYKWAADGKSCTATRTCSKNTMASCNQSAAATVSSETALKETCEAKGKTKYTAKFDVSWAATQTQTLEDRPALGHKWTVGYEWKQVDGNWTCTATRTCSNNTVPAECKLTATATVTSAVTKAPGCTIPGDTTYTATFDVDWAAEQKKVVADLSALGHDISTAWSSDATNHWNACTRANCDAKDAVYATGAAHTFGADDRCTACGYDRVYLFAFSVTCESEVLLNYKLYISSELYNDPNAIVCLTKAGRWGDVVKEIKMNELVYVKAKVVNGIEAPAHYVATMGIASGEMMRGVTIEIVDGNGKRVTIREGKDDTLKYDIAHTHSVADYAALVPEGHNDYNVTKALVTYGGYAQAYFDVDADSPVYNVMGGALSLDDVTADKIGFDASSEGTVEGLKLSSYLANLDSNLSLVLLYLPNGGIDPNDGYIFKVEQQKIAKNSDNVWELVYDGDEPVYEEIAADATVYQRGDHYQLIISGIVPAHMDRNYRVTVTKDVDEEAGASVAVVSLLAYVKSTLNTGSNGEMVDLVKAMYLYNEAANERFKS